MIAVGDYIGYNPDDTSQATYSKNNLVESITGSTENTANIARERLKWRVLRIYDDGSMDIVGFNGAWATNTENQIYLKGATGYNNAVYVLNDICEKLYSRQNIKARSLAIEDYTKWLTAEGKEQNDKINNANMSALVIGNEIESINVNKRTVAFKKNTYYPNLYINEKGAGIETTNVNTNGINVSDKSILDKSIGSNAYKKANKLTITETNELGYYGFDSISITSANFGIGERVLSSLIQYNLLASRFVTVNNANKEKYAYFGIYYTSSGGPNSNNTLFESTGRGGTIHGFATPVVTLGPNVKITKSSSAASSTGTPHTITQY